MNTLLILPLITPLMVAAVSFLVWRRKAWQKWLSVGGACMSFVWACALFESVRDGEILTMQAGGWAAPFGISLVADTFAAVMVLLTATMGLAVTIYAVRSIDERRAAFGFYPILQILLMGVTGAFLTGDLFNLYVWFEVMLMSSFVLLALGGERAQIEGGIKYVTINLLSSAIFLAAIGFLYSVTGTLNMADLALKIGALPASLTAPLSVLFLVAFGVKAGLFPLFFWLPASYHTPPAVVSAVFAGLLTKVGVYALIRTFTLIFAFTDVDVDNLLLTLAGLTMVTGGLGALAQTDARRVLSFLIIAHIGVAVMGLGLNSTRALAGTIFYLIEDVIVLTNLFLIVGIMGRVCGTFELARMGGMYRTHPMLGALFLVPAWSLSGVPPFSGFFAKLALVQAGLEVEAYTVVALSLVVGILTLVAMMRLWAEAFWKPSPYVVDAAQDKMQTGKMLLVPVCALSLMSIGLGIGAEAVFGVALTAAGQIDNANGYIEAVLGVRR
ncbi:MAG: Na+/H+ antiporter subunit D [Pyrinomonadaceae bacterium MAG19_C2-C3]|nr:Na+/H+ antiporter subunit D [Pyrinomonadaceae bacterium MAG19_C2-C3]